MAAISSDVENKSLKLLEGCESNDIIFFQLLYSPGDFSFVEMTGGSDPNQRGACFRRSDWLCVVAAISSDVENKSLKLLEGCESNDIIFFQLLYSPGDFSFVEMTGGSDPNQRGASFRRSDWLCVVAAISSDVENKSLKLLEGCESNDIIFFQLLYSPGDFSFVEMT